MSTFEHCTTMEQTYDNSQQDELVMNFLLLNYILLFVEKIHVYAKNLQN